VRTSPAGRLPVTGAAYGRAMDDIYAWTTNGRRLHVDLADARAHELVAADGDLNPLSTVLWQHALNAHHWELVVDVGVNYGEMLVGVDLPAGARVVGFEPNASVRALATRTLADNGVVAELRGEAVGAAAGRASFALDPSWSGLSSFATGPGTVEVDVTTLDEVLGDAASYCVKVDVEGFEEDVLRGGARSLARDVPWVLMLEVKHMPAGLLAGLAERWAVVLLSADGASLYEADAGTVDALLDSGRVYGQDALLVGRAARHLLPR
jgi:FkbM family methyltransferase